MVSDQKCEHKISSLQIEICLGPSANNHQLEHSIDKLRIDKCFISKYCV